MNLIQNFYNAFINYSKNIAFCVDNERITYNQFLSLINGSRLLLENQPEFKPGTAVGVLCNEFAETYASVFAIWFSGGIFVPLNPSSPVLVNKENIRKNAIVFIFSPGDVPQGIELDGVKILNNKHIVSFQTHAPYKTDNEQILYILNTSGSTGIPKNVPINRRNLTAFIEGFLEIYPELTEADNFLQTYELTADAAFTGYLIPFLLGATVYSVPSGQFKPLAVAKIISEKPITWVQVTPSLLACLHPFFHSFNLEGIRHFHFGGEALPADLVEEWRKYVPNAEISNVYGPTETTVTATIYKCIPGEAIKSKKNVVCIGKPLKSVIVGIVQMDRISRTGELYIAGDQVMDKYLFTKEQPFISIALDPLKYYPTGDLVEKDDAGFLFYQGRLDEQVKISGYRVDLIEIENAIRSLLPESGNVAAVAIEKFAGAKQLIVFIENYSGNGKEITEKLVQEFTHWKIPDRIIGIPRFPISLSGKTDKKALVANFLNRAE